MVLTFIPASSTRSHPSATGGLGPEFVERPHRARGSQTPESLARVSAEFLPAIPVDPFDGQPMRHRTLGPGSVVYSAGQGLQDHGGKDRPRTNKAKSGDHDERFFVER